MATIYLQLSSAPDEDKYLVWEERCPTCGRDHPSLWAIERKLKDVFGHFPVFRINGEDHVPDTSLPMRIDRIPRDAIRLTNAQFAAIWHDESDDHTFGAETSYRRLKEEQA
jgi:hypothetical protein